MQTWGLSMSARFLLALYIVGCFVGCGYTHASPVYCVFSKQSVVKVSSSLDKSGNEDGDTDSYVTGQLLDGNRTEKCPPASKFCYALWQEDFLNKSLSVILAQGCWESAAEFDCSENECVSNKRPPKALNNTKFCCCIGSKCNENISDGFLSYEDDEPPPRFVEQASYDTHTVIIAVVTMCSVAVVIMFAACVTYHMCSSTPKPSPDAAYLMEPPPPSSPLFNIDTLKIRESIGMGRYGHVYRGTLYNQTVAVKIFSAQNKPNYLSERHIYCLPFMDHPCLPKLFGAEERVGADDRPEYLLVLSYAPRGCLQEFLTSNTFDWATFCKMAQTVTQGLAHLHTEINKDGKVKMCVAHRDLTSRNILVKGDGSCMLCDFGFAICISGSKYYTGGEEQVAEATSLNDVGTMRYMAPEVLEGAVNLRDCESSLKQIDVYALGLVLWEIATRCFDLFQGVEVPEFKLPFVAEIGTHPTMEQMQILVSKNKARPLFPDIWKCSNPAVRSLKETIEDCWDQDAEARLTALCVQERLSELPVTWERHKAGVTIQGVSPTVNPTSAHRVDSTTASVQSSASPCNKGASFELPAVKGGGEMSSPSNGPNASRNCECNISEHTAETSITVSPSELTPNSCASCSSNSGNTKNLVANNSLVNGSIRVTVPLQPYQGKNPVMERNLVMDPVEEMAISGNSLVQKKGVHISSGASSANSQNQVDVFNTLQPTDASESNALVSNDELSHAARTCNPIPYVQNAVHMTSTIPKQPNVPGNGHTLQASVPISESELKGKSKTRKVENKILIGLKKLFRFRKIGGSFEEPDSICVSTPLIANTSNSACVIDIPKFQNCNGQLANNDTKPKESLDTEVYISCPDDDFSMMTQTVVRPVANKQVYSQTVPCDSELQNNSSYAVSNAPIINAVVQSQTHPSLSMESNEACTKSLQAVKRPNTLPVTKFGSRRVPEVMPGVHRDQVPLKPVTKDNSSKKGVVNGILDLNNALAHTKSDRSSLYDDRMMSTDSESHPYNAPHFSNTASLQSSTSVPHSIDAFCEAEVAHFDKACENTKIK